MNRSLDHPFGHIWYVALTYGCTAAHHPETASPENSLSNAELRETVMVVECLVPEPTVTGFVIASTIIAAGALGVRT